MQTSPKYLIHADVRANGVVERSDVVGAVFGQTEGLLGDQLDLRDLQDSSKLGRIDVEVDSEDGRSVGTITIASGLDRVETSVLAAALETIDRVGPCRAECTVTEIEDAREAKRRRLVERATELVAEFEEETITGDRLVDEVRRRARVENVTNYEGLPAGPRVEDSDAVIVVEGRADVRQLLKYGIKNAIAVEGTDVPEAVAGLTRDRTITAFLDGDRGGDLILQELTQVGDVDYVAFAPAEQTVETLDRTAIMSALRKKIPYEQAVDGASPREVFAPTDGGTVSVPPDSPTDGADDAPPDAEAADTPDDSADRQPATDREPATLAGQVRAVVGEGSGRVRLLDETFETVEEAPAGEAFEAIEDAPEPPHSVVLDGELDQRVLDIAAQRGATQVVAASTGEFVKQPTSVRIRTADALLD